MTFSGILGTIFIEPLKLVFEIIFSLANNVIGHPGLTIIVLSLVMNFLVLPLYRRADAMQEEARDVENRLKPGIDHIKKTFSGDERMMVLQTYYRQNNYSPTDALNGSASLLLEVPFFIAAYQFLSHVACLQGVSLGPIADLGAPDGMLVLGGMTVNVLPVLMTLINVVSGAIYSRGFPLKTKVQLYGVALIFLVFLYNSPAGLVFYWTLNNVFSLIKNIFYKLKNPGLVLAMLAFAAGLLMAAAGLFLLPLPTVKVRLYVAIMGIALMLPLVWMLLRRRMKLTVKTTEPKPDKKLFVAGSVFLTVLTGLLIPSTFIAASPQEYVDINYFHNPLNYILMSTALAVGFFMVWLRVFYWLSSPGVKCLFDRLVWVLAVLALVNYMFFGRNLGVISAQLQFENEMRFASSELLLNLAVMVLGAVLLWLFAARFPKLPSTVLALACAALVCMSAINAFTIKSSVQKVSAQKAAKSEVASIPLSRDGKNVVVLMLDRALGQAVPYIFNEKPELVEQFDGFTYYSNVISYGGYTNFGTPPLLGGYEYTPVEMNRRDGESLVDKHNEALLVMPRLFADEGYEVTVCDPVYANYQWIPDLSIYEDYDDINAYNTIGRFVDDDQKQVLIDNNYRNFFLFSVMKCLPVTLQDTLYSSGSYNQVASVGSTPYTQIQHSSQRATGYSTSFMEAYSVLDKLHEISRISDSEENTYLFLMNDLPHRPLLLQTPDYVPAESVDNREYDEANASRFTIDGKELKTDRISQMTLYHANVASYLQLGEWFDWLRENGVYDNTRIILVSDHGFRERMMDELIMGEDELDVSSYYPLLMVKDFDSKGFTVSDEFMTNADVPSLSVQGLIENPVNPFTGKPINSDEKTAHEQFIILSGNWELLTNSGSAFEASKWASVKDNIWDEDNWTFYDETMVLAEHSVE